MLTQVTRTSGPRRAPVNETQRGIAQRGFTLMELMVVVAITGILAALATYGVRKYTLSAKKAETISMLTQIRGAEEAYIDEMFVYRGGPDLETWNPTADPTPDKRSWVPAASNDMTTALNELGVQPTGPVYYSYAVVAGVAGDELPEIPGTWAFTLPDPTGPFYIAMAKGDLNGDGTFTYALAWSGSAEIIVNDTF